jgi:hypothetical protein
MSTKITWNEENTAKLVELAGNGEVSQADLISIAETLGTTSRSIGAKLRRMDYDVAKAAPKASAWNEAQETALTALVNENANQLTYAEIAASFEGGSFNAKQIQGKLLSMELFSLVRKADKVAPQRTYTEAEEAKFVGLANDGATMETLAEAFGKPIASVRGKALSLLKSEHISEMPKQETSSAKARTDIFADVDVAGSTIEQLVETTGKSVRGIKSTLSRRGISCSDYDGAAKRAKLDANKEA